MDASVVNITAEKKQHTLKNTVMALPATPSFPRTGNPFSWHNHDYLMLKQELPPELDWFADINVRVDLGYLRHSIRLLLWLGRLPSRRGTR